MEGLLSNISRVLRKRQNASYLVVSGKVTCIKNGAPIVLRSLPDSVTDGRAIERSKAIRMAKLTAKQQELLLADERAVRQHNATNAQLSNRTYSLPANSAALQELLNAQSTRASKEKLLLDIRWYLKELGVPTAIVNLTTTKKDNTKDLHPCIDRLAKMLEDFSGGKVNCKVQQDFSITSFRGTP